MANEVYKKSRPTITAQDSASITADSYSGGAQTVVDQTTISGNAEGALEVELYLDVTIPPSNNATAQVWLEASYDNITFTVEDFCCSVGIGTSAGLYRVGYSELTKYGKYKIKAIDYGFTAELLAVPKLPEIQ